MVNWESIVFQEGPSFVALVGFVLDELCYALNMRLGVSAVAKICIMVIWVTGTAHFDRWLSVFQRDMLPAHTVRAVYGFVFHYLWLRK
jgi:hypothetical protein